MQSRQLLVILHTYMPLLDYLCCYQVPMQPLIRPAEAATYLLWSTAAVVVASSTLLLFMPSTFVTYKRHERSGL